MPPPSPALSDGSTFAFTDGGALIYRQLEVRKPSGETRTFELDYQAGGSDIFYLHAGPDGCIYGSSILPLHLFRYTPESGELTDLGQCSTATGEAYSMANFEGKIYISSYPGRDPSPNTTQRNLTISAANPTTIRGTLDALMTYPIVPARHSLARSVVSGPLPSQTTAGGAAHSPTTTRKLVRKRRITESVVTRVVIPLPTCPTKN